MPNMGKQEYDRLILEQYIARIVFKGEKYPYIAPFLYVFDGKYLYFLSTRYGKKLKYFRQNPYVTVKLKDMIPIYRIMLLCPYQGTLLKLPMK